MKCFTYLEFFLVCLSGCLLAEVVWRLTKTAIRWFREC